MNKIDVRQRKAIINAYCYRLKALNIVVNNSDLEHKLLILPNDELNNFFTDIMKMNSNSITETLNKMNIPSNNLNQTSEAQTNNIDYNVNSSQSNSLGGRQYVLSTNPVRSHEEESI